MMLQCADNIIYLEHALCIYACILYTQNDYDRHNGFAVHDHCYGVGPHAKDFIHVTCSNSKSNTHIVNNIITGRTRTYNDQSHWRQKRQGLSSRVWHFRAIMINNHRGVHLFVEVGRNIYIYTYIVSARIIYCTHWRYELKASLRQLKIIAMAQNGNLVNLINYIITEKVFGTHGMKYNKR